MMPLSRSAAHVLAVDINDREARFLLHSPDAEDRSGAVPVSGPVTQAMLSKLLHDVAEAAGVSPEDRGPGEPFPPTFTRKGSSSDTGAGDEAPGRKKPPALVVATPETGAWDETGQSSGPADMRALRYQLFRSAFADTAGPSFDELLMDAPPEAFLRLRAIQRMTDGLVADVLGAAILGITADPVVLSRSWRQGILVLLAEHDCLRAALVFQNSLFGIFERPWPKDFDALSRELDSFRLGWLPQETAAASGGWVVTSPALPAEAEGFQPLYASGARAHLFREHGQMASGGDPAMAGCRGLAYAFLSRQRFGLP